MRGMKIITKITFPEYRRLMYSMYYRRPMGIIFTALGVIFIILQVLNFIGVPLYKETPYWGLVCGIMFVFYIPFAIHKNSKKIFVSNLRLHEQIEYDFTNDTLIATGESFTAEKDLRKVYKIVELKDWFLLYESAAIFNLIPKKNMTPAEVNELREIFRNVGMAGEKKLRSA